MARVIVIPILLGVLLLAACGRAPVSRVAGEELHGKWAAEGDVAAFLGIPFAEPPVGELRWRAPQPLKTRLEQRDATQFAPACMQTMRILDWYRWLAEQYGGSGDYYGDLEVSEDCLYLNLWTPSLDTEAKLPVMVWIHGGSNKSGWSYEPNYHGDALATEGVVVVSVGYRQGLFGFFSHPELPADEPQANFAYWDLLAAFTWIQENIAGFGGDPNRVTLFGESAGAQNIVALMASDAADGLFHRGIAQSTAGFGLNRMATLADEQQRGLALAAALDLNAAGSLAAMRELPADELLSVYDATFPDYYHSPAIDQQLLMTSTWTAIHKDGLRGRELIIGSNDHEWYASTAEDSDWDDVAEQAKDLLPGMDYGRAVAVVRAEEDDPRRALDRLQTAASMLCASLHVAAASNARSHDAWVYHFTRAPIGINGVDLGAYHGAEYPYVFNTRDPYFATTDIDAALQQAMQSYWVNFARSGDPNSAALPTWPPYSEPRFEVQELGDDVFTKAAPEAELCEIFEAGLTSTDNDQADE